jgi:micrococcal nuclease
MEDQYIRYAKVDRVVDGDTIDVSVDLGFGVWKKERLRLARINTPEIRGEEKEAGLAAKAFVEVAISDQEMIIVKTTKETGKFGRYIAEIEVSSYDQWENLNDLLLKEGYAKPYPG